jgi:hypothetical protein
MGGRGICCSRSRAALIPCSGNRSKPSATGACGLPEAGCPLYSVVAVVVLAVWIVSAILPLPPTQDKQILFFVVMHTASLTRWHLRQHCLRSQ